MDELLKLGGGDKEFVNEMIHLFIKGANECTLSLKIAIETNDRKAIGDAAHKIAPACRHLGATKMLELVKMLEKQADTDVSIAELGILINKLENEASKTIEEVKKHLS